MKVVWPQNAGLGAPHQRVPCSKGVSSKGKPGRDGLLPRSVSHIGFKMSRLWMILDYDGLFLKLKFSFGSNYSYVRYCKLHLLLERLGETPRYIIMVYAKSYLDVNEETEKDYDRICM